jgi:hypothetical protein
MGIIECRVRNAFKNYEEDGDVFKFAIEMAHIGDYSIRSMYNWYILTAAVNQIKKEKIDESIEKLSKLTNNEITDLEF